MEYQGSYASVPTRPPFARKEVSHIQILNHFFTQ